MAGVAGKQVGAGLDGTFEVDGVGVGAELIHVEGFGEDGPGLIAESGRGIDGVDAGEVDAAEDEGDHGGVQVGAGGETAGGDGAAPLDLGEKVSQRGGADGVDGAAEAGLLQRLALVG